MGDTGGCDPAMLELFRAELDTHVPVLNSGLLALEKGQPDNKELEAMMRAAHSIKGAARIVGIAAAVRVAHVMEDCFSAAQARRITLSSEAVDVLLQGVDALQRVCLGSADATLDEPALQALIERIAAIRDNRSTSPPPQPAPARPAVVELAAAATPAAPVPDHRLMLPAVVDAAAAERLRAELCGMLRQQAARILVDFGQVRHVSAAALALLASFARTVGPGDTPPAVQAVGVAAETAVLLRTTGLDGTFKRLA